MENIARITDNDDFLENLTLDPISNKNFKYVEHSIDV